MAAEPAESERATQKARVFFALWPDADAAARLHALGQAAHANCGGRRMRRDTLHMTLAFIGDVEAARVADLIAAAGEVAVEPFTLAIDRMGSWRHNRIAWAGTHHVPQPLAALASGLDAKLRTAGFELERRKFFPHVTLLRRIHSAFPEQPVEPFEWAVERFVLVRSQRMPDGARYEVIHAWPRGAGAGLPR